MERHGADRWIRCSALPWWRRTSYLQRARRGAYKAQRVRPTAYPSQSGYLSVPGYTTEPASPLAVSAGGRACAGDSTTVVCFTPYLAFASTGTALSAEVWGSDRAWLQAVDSPTTRERF